MSVKDLKCPVRAVNLPYGKVVVEAFEEGSMVTAGGIIIPEPKDATTKIAKLISISKDLENNADGLKVGDIVVVNHLAGNFMTLAYHSANTHKWFAMFSTDILAVWEEDPAKFYEILETEQKKDDEKKKAENEERRRKSFEANVTSGVTPKADKKIIN